MTNLIFANLPDELIHKIINYTNVITFRNGKYIDKINENDCRYALVRKITRPIQISYMQYFLLLTSYNSNVGYIFNYSIENDSLIFAVSFINKAYWKSRIIFNNVYKINYYYSE